MTADAQGGSSSSSDGSSNQPEDVGGPSVPGIELATNIGKRAFNDQSSDTASMAGVLSSNQFRSNVELEEKPRQMVILFTTIAVASYLVSAAIATTTGRLTVAYASVLLWPIAANQ